MYCVVCSQELIQGEKHVCPPKVVNGKEAMHIKGNNEENYLMYEPPRRSEGQRLFDGLKEMEW